MILDTISSLELKALYIIREEEKRINSLLKIKQHLSQIDFSMEDIHLNNPSKLKSLLETLKGDKLDNDEVEIISELINNDASTQ